MKHVLTALMTAAVVVLPLVTTDVGAYEEPAYVVEAQTEAYELRRYEPYIVAETRVEGGFRAAGNEAFRRLAGYIFGNNVPQERMAMTAPVLSQARSGEKMAMTAPVVSQPVSGDGDANGWTYQFVMERKYSLETLPAPVDPRVELRTVPGRWVAVRRFGGFWTESNIGDQERELLERLEADGLTPLAVPELARYNGPMTPWFLRRNEILVQVTAPAG